MTFTHGIMEYICAPGEISRCVGDEDVEITIFGQHDIVRTVDEYVDSEQWSHYNRFSVVELKDGRFAWISDCSWGTCELCSGESLEVIVSTDLEKLWHMALTDVARIAMKSLEQELFSK